MDQYKIKQAIKTLLRNRGVNYQELANFLEVSHATVKRILTSEELTLTRLLHICDYLNFSLNELLVVANQQVEEEGIEFTYEQELFLASDPRFYLYLTCIYSGQSPSHITKKFKLNRYSQDRYLRKLEQNDLIRVTGKGHVKPAHPRLPNWIRRGPMAEFHAISLFKSFTEFFVARVSQDMKTAVQDPKKDSAQKTTATMHCAPMSRATYAEYLKEVHDLHRKWNDIASLEERTQGEEKLGRQVVLNLNGWVETEAELGSLENVLGEISNF